MEQIRASSAIDAFVRRRYWRMKGYRRLNTRRKLKMRVLGNAMGSISEESQSTRRWRFWRIKLQPRLNLRRIRFSPKKFILGLRDSYVNMMLKIASTSMMMNGFGGEYIDDGVPGFGITPVKEYDERLIMEIYKSIVKARGQVVPGDPDRIGPQICH